MAVDDGVTMQSRRVGNDVEGQPLMQDESPTHRPAPARPRSRTRDKRWWTGLVIVIMLPVALLVWMHIQPSAFFGGGAIGMIFPPVAWWHTSATYAGPPELWPPAHWKPSSRIVVSMSTRPDRLLYPDQLKPTIESILNQDTPPAMVYLNVPRGVNKRTGQVYNVPAAIQSIEGLTILRDITDIGPLTKLYPALEVEHDPDTIVITVDDDKLYPHNLLRTLAWHLENSYNTAVGCCGWSIMWTPEYWWHVSVPYFLRRGNGVYTDVLQGVCGNGYKREFFNVTELKDTPSECYTVDDLWVAGYLGTHGVKKALIANRLDPEETKMADRSRAWALSSHNSKGAQVYDACIHAIHRKHGEWTKSRNYW